MSKKILVSRRNFLKTSAIGAAGLAVIGPGLKKSSAANITTNLVNLSATQINKDVDNLRVAYITDSTMVRSPNYPGWDSFNNPTNTTTGVNYTVVESNMDKLACALANKTNASDAWALLLKIPSTKTWATAKAAIKVNAFASAHPSVPIVAKICRVLVDMGMAATNITIFDANASPGMYNNSTYVGANSQLIPTGVVFSSDGFPNQIVFPASAGGETIKITKAIDGVDIFVNIAVNKGHDQLNEYSGVTMTQKNHKGTMFFGCNDGDGTKGLQRLVNANSCDYIAGNIPAAYPAKQQLCIVDSLWCTDSGTWTGSITNGKNANSIVMGTFAGAVDYVGTMKIRQQKFAASTWNQTIVDGFITGYGYPASAKTTVMTPVTGAGQGLVDASTVTETFPRENANHTREGIVNVSVSGNSIKTVNTNLYLAKGETVQTAAIFNMQGKMVRQLSVHSGSMQIVWDGKLDNGRIVQAGSYIVKVQSEHATASGEFLIARSGALR